MKKLFSVLLAAVLAAGTMVLPTAAADGDIVYLQTFDDVASYDDLGWEIVETLTTNTSTYTIENGALTVDNLGGNDSYTVVVPASVMDEVNEGDYTVGYDFTLLESGDTARYLAMLLNYDREVGNTYNSLHMRMKGYADWQNRFVGTWSSNMDTAGGYQGLPLFTDQTADNSISARLFGLPFDAAQNVIAGKTIRYEMRVSNSGGYVEVYMNGVLISGTDEAGWDQFTWASEDYSEICLKSGGSILGTVDNIVVAKGLGIPEGTIPAMGGASASGLPATEYDSIANYAGIKPVIDGKIDAIWDATAAQESTWPGDRDGEGISGYTKILWDEDYLYLLGVVNDPTTLQEANPTTTDSIDFWISETYSDDMGYPNAGDYQVTLSPYDTLGGYYIGNEKAPESVAEHAAVINGDGTYVLEIVMPWMDPEFKPEAGKVFGYNASFNNDIDGDGARDSWTSWVEWNGMPYWSDCMWLNQVELVKADVAVAADEAPAAEAPAAEAAAPAADAGLPAAYPASGTAIPDGSVLIAGELIGSENGWDGTAGSGRASAFDGNIETFFDPATASVDYCGIDAGEEMILTKIMIHPRTTFLDRFNGATIEASNDPEFEESVELFFSVEQAAEVAFVDCTAEMETAENTGYRYFRYINYMSHGDVAEVELYGYAKDGSNPTYGAAEAPAAEAPAAEAAPAAAEFVTYTAYPEMTGEELVYATGDMDMMSGYDAKGGIGVDLFNLASGGTSYCLKRDTSAWYDFEVAEKTDVTFYVGYIARDGSNRGLDYAVDGGARIFMDLVESAEQQWVSATFTVDAGKHSFYLYAPTGMDDSTLKSCDIYTIELYGTPAAAAAEEASAAGWITRDVISKYDEAPDWYVEDDAVELEVWDMGDTNANSSATGADGIYPSGYVFLKAKGLGNFEVPFDVSESGNYNIGFVLMAWKKSVPRSTMFSVDGAEPIYVCYDYADEDQYSEQFLTGPTMYLEKGEHTLTLALADDFDDSTVKSLYFDKFIYAPAADDSAAEAEAAAKAEAEAQAAAEAAEKAAEVVEEAPQTFDFGVIAAISALVSLAGFSLTKKR